MKADEMKKIINVKLTSKIQTEINSRKDLFEKKKMLMPEELKNVENQKFLRESERTLCEPERDYLAEELASDSRLIDLISVSVRDMRPDVMASVEASLQDALTTLCLFEKNINDLCAANHVSLRRKDASFMKFPLDVLINDLMAFSSSPSDQETVMQRRAISQRILGG